MTVSEVAGNETPEPFLARGVPKLESDCGGVVYLNAFAQKVHAHRCLAVLAKLLSTISVYQAGLPHATVSHQNHFEFVQFVAIIIIHSLLHLIHIYYLLPYNIIFYILYSIFYILFIYLFYN